MNEKVAWLGPAAVGAKSKLTVQLAFEARVVPQVSPAIEKLRVFAPDIAMLLRLTEDAPRFVRVTVCRLPLAPTATSCQETLVGFTRTPTTEVQLVSGIRHRASSKVLIAIAAGFVLWVVARRLTSSDANRGDIERITNRRN